MSEQSEQLQPLILMDNPEAYVRQARTYGHILLNGEDFKQRAPEFTARQKVLVEVEAYDFDIDPYMDPDGFVDEHLKLMDKFATSFTENLPDLKGQIVDYIAAYFSKGDDAVKKELQDRLGKRLEATKKVGLSDALREVRPGNEYAVFNMVDRQIYLDSAEVVFIGNSARDDTDDFARGVYRTLIAHEIIHGLFAAGTQEVGPLKHWPIRNGLQVNHHSNFEDPLNENTVKHGQWLSEATIESFRREAAQTENVLHPLNVTFLETLDELSPGLRDTLFLAAIDGQAPGSTYGKVELLIGPTGIEQAGALLSRPRSNLKELDELRDSLIDLLPRDLQVKATEVYNRKLPEMLAGSGIDIDEASKFTTQSPEITK